MPRRNWYDTGEGGGFGHPGQDVGEAPTPWTGGAPYGGPAAPPVPFVPGGTVNPTPTPTPGDGTGGDGGYGTFNIDPYQGALGAQYNFGAVPQFVPPNFRYPTGQDAMNEPGYQFRLDSGKNALEHSAAAKGTLRTGGSLKDLIEYGQNFGAQEYSNVFNRALSGYDKAYTAAKDAYAPLFSQYNNQFGAEQSRAEAEAQRRFQAYQLYVDAQLRREGLASAAALGA